MLTGLVTKCRSPSSYRLRVLFRRQITRRQNDRYVGPHAEQFPSQSKPRHRGHRKIRDDRVERIGVRLTSVVRNGVSGTMAGRVARTSFNESVHRIMSFSRPQEQKLEIRPLDRVVIDRLQGWHTASASCLATTRLRPPFLARNIRWSAAENKSAAFSPSSGKLASPALMVI